MVTQGDQRRAWRIIEAFAERTGLEARRSDQVAEFPVSGWERDVQIVAILTDIDPEWRHHLELGTSDL